VDWKPFRRRMLRRGLGGGSDWSRLEVHNRRGEAEAREAGVVLGKSEDRSVGRKPFRRRTQFWNLGTGGEKQRSDEEGKYRMGPRPALK
jgi:hypothetical protein